MSPRPPPLAILVLAVLVAVLLSLLMSGCASPRAQPPVMGTELLGPEQGERVADYLARARHSLPATGEVWALVQLDEPVDAGTAAALTEGVRVSRVVYRVPLPRVQTALVTVPLPGQHPAAELREAQLRAGDERQQAGERAAANGQSRATGVATAEAAELRAGCACVLALLVRADRAGLDAVASRPRVRVIHAATQGLPLPAVAVSPLLPEQRDVVGPVPDDGPVPTPPIPATSR
jgi:hypothetical protein